MLTTIQHFVTQLPPRRDIATKLKLRPQRLYNSILKKSLVYLTRLNTLDFDVAIIAPLTNDIILLLLQIKILQAVYWDGRCCPLETSVCYCLIFLHMLLGGWGGYCCHVYKYVSAGKIYINI